MTDKELLQAIGKTPTPVTSAGDLAEYVTLSRERVRQKLERLVEAGDVQKGSLNGETNTIYWIED